MAKKTISQLIKLYFINHPREDLEHGPVVDWVTEQYLKEHKTPPRDIWRGIRKLHQDGYLIKVQDGIYRYDPGFIENRELEDFSPSQKELIFKRDNFRCVICGLGVNDGVTIHADHIKPKDLGGKAEINNGQTLCATHNFRKKNYKQTESGKRMFIRLYEAAKALGDSKTMEFCKEILETYDEYDINGHISWKP